MTITLLRPTAGAVLRRHDLEFQWPPVEGAASYEVQILTAAGDPVWQGETNTNHLRPPDSIALKGGEPYFAWVSANLATGKPLRSKAVRFEVAAP
jgi:hypothetical protein